MSTKSTPESKGVATGPGTIPEVQKAKATAQAHPASKPAPKMRLLYGAMGAVVLVSAVAFFVLKGLGSGVDKSKPSISYTTRQGIARSDPIANTPMSVTVRIPWLDGTTNTMLSGVLLKLVDENGQPADFGGRRDLLPMRSTVEIEAWEYVGSAPSKPGTYRAQVRLMPFARGKEMQVLDLPDPPLRVVADTEPPLVSGYIMAREDDLWIVSTDGKRERRLTYIAPSESQEYANDPAWSPDGKSIAFAYSPKVRAGEVPRTELWSVSPDGTNLRQLVAHGPNEALYAPAWSADGRVLYFTVEASSTDPTSGGALSYRIDQVDLATGLRSQVAADAEWASAAGQGGEIVYLEHVPVVEGGASSSGQRIVISRPDGSGKRVIVPETEALALYAPRVSPDGKWLVYASVNQNRPTPTPAGFDLWKWLMLEPEVASAHGVPWELYIVPTTGGKPVQLTSLSEDEPFAAWHDSTDLSFLGLNALYTLSIDTQGKAVGDPRVLAEGVQHGRLTWHAP